MFERPSMVSTIGHECGGRCIHSPLTLADTIAPTRRITKSLSLPVLQEPSTKSDYYKRELQSVTKLITPSTQSVMEYRKYSTKCGSSENLTQKDTTQAPSLPPNPCPPNDDNNSSPESSYCSTPNSSTDSASSISSDNSENFVNHKQLLASVRRINDVDWILSSPEDKLKLNFLVGDKVFILCQVCFCTKLLFKRQCCDIAVCDECLAAYYSSLVSQGNIQIECPSPECQKSVSRDEILHYLEDESLRVCYSKYLVDANSEPGKRTCPNCCLITTVDTNLLTSKKVIKYGMDVVCSKCQFRWCYSCHGPWHADISCKDSNKGMKALKTWAKEKHYGEKNAQRCPSCKIFIQRTSGCDHMVCKVCHTDFCYRCGGTHITLRGIGGHHDALSILGCPYILWNGKKKHLRRFVRGSIFTGKVVAVPVIASLAVGLLPLAVAALLVGAPTVGFIKLHKHLQKKKMNRSINNGEVYGVIPNQPSANSS